VACRSDRKWFGRSELDKAAVVKKIEMENELLASAGAAMETKTSTSATDLPRRS
jgi:hypothetical protein